LPDLSAIWAAQAHDREIFVAYGGKSSTRAAHRLAHTISRLDSGTHKRIAPVRPSAALPFVSCP